MARRLSASVLDDLRDVATVPLYDRERVLPGIVHLGVGAFHRAHQAVLVDDCLNRGDLHWGIVAASLRSGDTKAALEPQDSLYTLALRDGAGERLRIIGAILRTLVAPEEPAELLAALTDAHVRIVTLTVTEKGYTTNLATGALVRDHPDIVHDLANPSSPRSVLGYLSRALLLRRKAGVAAFTLLSCDNLPSNGKTLHRALTEFATLVDVDLGRYIAEEVDCPSSMVDRIVPATTGDDKARISASLGVDDAWPVVAEPFFQWVIEDNFALGRPLWEQSGVEFVRDVAPFEHMKVRLLNGAHTAIAAIGQVAGFETVSETIAAPPVRNFLNHYWRQVAPTLDGMVDAAGYSDRLLKRFANPALNHRTAQIAGDASQKVPQRVLAPLAELIADKQDHHALVFAVAAWIRSCADKSESGASLPRNDPAFQAWKGKPAEDADSAATVAAFLDFSVVFDPAWASDRALVGDLTQALQNIRQYGILAALDRAFGERTD